MKNIKRFLSPLILGITLLASVANGSPSYGLSSFPESRAIVIGYLNGLRSETGLGQTLTPAQIDTEIAALHWDGYDAVVHAFIEPLGDGSFNEDFGNFKYYQSALLKYAHQNGKSVILSVGGASPSRLADQFLELAGDATKRASFVTNCVNYLKTHGYDGIDIDWEFPKVADNANGRAFMTQLMQDLYTAVKAENEDYIVMFGTGPGYFLGSYDFAALKDYSDLFFYFGYDWKAASPTGANGPISAPGSGQQWTTNGDTLFEQSVRGGIQYVIDKGFPASKIICGLPFYGSANNAWSAIRATYFADQATYDAAIHPDALEVKINNEWFTTPPALKKKMDALLTESKSVLNDKATIRGVGTWEIGHEHRTNPDLSTAFETWINAYGNDQITLTVSDTNVIEGNSGTNEIIFNARLSAAPTSQLSLDYATSGIDATQGIDYEGKSGSLTFNAGQMNAQVRVLVYGDLYVESDETFGLNLTNPSDGLILENGRPIGTILNDDINNAENYKSRNWTPPTFGGHAQTKDHDKQIVGYITQYDAWKGTKQGLDSAGVLTQANVDFSKYTILNYSFFGIAKDGSMHSGDFGDPERWKNRDLPRDQWREQQPNPLINLDYANSYDFYILHGEINPTNSLTQEAIDAGFNLKEGTTDIWQWCEGALEGPFPIPVPDSNGAPGLFELAAQHGVKVLASIGGWSLSQHFPDLADPAKRAVFIKECQDLIKLGFDGIDLDWEFPGPFTGMNFTGTDADYETLAIVAEEIRVAIGHDKLLTIALHSIPNRLEHQKWNRLLAVTDYFNLFGYDFAGGWSNKANHNAPLYSYPEQEDADISLSATIEYIKNTLNLPLDKFNIGYPGYGRGVITTANPASLGAQTNKVSGIDLVPDGPVTSAADYTSWGLGIWDGTPNYFHIVKTMKENPGAWTRYWDDNAKVPYLIKGNKFLSYDDPQSVAYKAQKYLDEGMAGTIVWTVYGDLELGSLRAGDENDKLFTATTVQSKLVDTVNNVFAGIATPREYDDGTTPDNALLQERLDTLRDRKINISVSGASVIEGNTGTKSLTFEVYLNQAAEAAVSVDYNTADVIAKSTEDYFAASGTINFAVGETSKNISITINGDTMIEPDETFTLNLSNPSDDAAISNASATGTIIDDDGPVSFSIEDADVIEGEKNQNKLRFKVNLKPAARGSLTVDYESKDGTAVSGQDYVSKTGTLSFSAGDSETWVEISIIGDTIQEADETLQVILENPSGDSQLQDSTATGTILNDDRSYSNNRNWTPPSFGGHAQTKDHNKQIVGYITQYDAWKGTKQGLESNGVLTQANVDFSKYTILNYSFFGIAKDGSMHSGDYGDPDRWKNRDLPRDQWIEQEPKPLLHEDPTSSWDYYILLGEINPINNLTQEAIDAGFNLKEGTTDIWQYSGGLLEGPFPIPVPNPNGAPGLFELAAQHGVKVLASIGGWSLSQHFPDLADPTKRAVFIKECQNLIQLGFDGIDLDWEFPGPFTGMNFTGTDADYETLAIVAEEIRVAIGQDKLLTIALHSIPNRLVDQKWNRLLAVTDYFNLFGYDFAGGWSDKANHNAPLYSYPEQQDADISLSATIEYIKNTLNLPLDKFNIGYPGYGRGVITTANPASLGAQTNKVSGIDLVPDGPVTSAADYTSWGLGIWDGTPNYFHIVKTMKDNPGDWTRYWDDNAKVPYLIKGNKFLSYDDPQSVAYKAQKYLDEGMAGTIVWTVYGDLELGSLRPPTSNKIKTATTVQSKLADTMNNVFAGIAAPSEYTGGTTPTDPVLKQRLDDLRSNNVIIEIIDTSVFETDSGNTDVRFVVKINKAQTSDISFNYTTFNKTALAGLDYVKASGTVEIPAGTTSNHFTVSVLGDTLEEGDESFGVELTDLNGVIIGDSITYKNEATCIIRDNDGIYAPTEGWTRHFSTTNNYAVEITSTSSWSNGFAGVLEIENKTSSPVNGWKLVFEAAWPLFAKWDTTVNWSTNGNVHTLTSDNVIAPNTTRKLDFNGGSAWSSVTNLRFNDKDLNSNSNVDLNTWLNQHGLANELDDTDNDGIANIIEFLLGTNPTSEASHQNIIPSYKELIVDGLKNTYFCVEIDADTLAENVEYRLETSTDLINWEGGDTFMRLHETVTNPDGSTHALWREAISTIEPKLKFARLVARAVND